MSYREVWEISGLRHEERKSDTMREDNPYRISDFPELTLRALNKLVAEMLGVLPSPLLVFLSIHLAVSLRELVSERQERGENMALRGLHTCAGRNNVCRPLSLHILPLGLTLTP